jgi:hypothetical protein
MSYNIYYKLQCILQAHYILNRTTKITFLNHILNRFIKGYFLQNTYAALLQGTVNIILFTLCC